MTPDYETLIRGGTYWYTTHKGIRISLAFHGYSEDIKHPHPGIWCYYLHLSEQMFYPEDWARLWLPETTTKWGPSHDLWNFPDFDFHGGVTFYKQDSMWDRRLGRKTGTIKVGCDYNHLWDKQAGFPDDYNSVLRDAQNSVEALLLMFPRRRTRCDYSGKWGEPDEFYTAVNGQTVHKSHKENLLKDGWFTWLPATQ